MAESFEAWWAGLGLVTKFTLIACVLTTGSFSLGMVRPDLLIVDFYNMVWQLQLWRPITASFLLGKFGFPWLIAVAMMVMYVGKHEEDHAGRPADMVWMMVLLIAALHVCAFFLGMPIVSFALSMSLVWIWCRRHEDAVLKIYMFSFKASTFPWALLIFHLVLGQSVVDDLVGILCGHAYFFAADMLPRTHHRVLIKTPQWLVNLLPPTRMGAYTVHAPAQARAAAGFPAPGQPERRHDWGRGNALGG
jgi:hypothetical protein